MVNFNNFVQFQHFMIKMVLKILNSMNKHRVGVCVCVLDVFISFCSRSAILSSFCLAFFYSFYFSCWFHLLYLGYIFSLYLSTKERWKTSTEKGEQIGVGEKKDCPIDKYKLELGSEKPCSAWFITKLCKHNMHTIYTLTLEDFFLICCWCCCWDPTSNNDEDEKRNELR